MKIRLPVAATAIIAIVLGGWWAESQWAAHRKLASLGSLDPRGSYEIRLDFPPERFHQLRLQDAGRLVEVRERTVFMMDVEPSALRAIAGEYWVEAVSRWNRS